MQQVTQLYPAYGGLDLLTIQRELDDLTTKYELSTEQQDLEARARMNPKITPGDYRLYMSLINTYPDILKGNPITIQPWKVRENAGWMSKNGAGSFFSSLVAIGAATYELAGYDAVTNKREATFTAILDLFVLPEQWDMVGTAKRIKQREEEQARRDKYMSVLVNNCEECGSEDIQCGLTPKCGNCGHVHQTVQHIDRARITILPAESDKLIDGLDDWTGEHLHQEQETGPIRKDIDRVLQQIETPPIHKQGCNHDASFKFINERTGKPMCVVCDAPWQKGKRA